MKADRILKPSKSNCEYGTVTLYKSVWIKEEFCIYKLALKAFGKFFADYKPLVKPDISCDPVKYWKRGRLYCCRMNPITTKYHLCHFCGNSHKGLWKLLHKKE